MDEVEFAELGDDITLTTTVDGHNIMAHAWGDKYLCRVCSDTSKGYIVAMCGLKSKNGSSCITKHILNTLQ